MGAHQRNTALRALLLAEAVALVFFETGGPIEVAYAKATLHAGDRGYGCCWARGGWARSIGSIVFARSVKRSLGVLLSGGTLAVGLAYIGLAAAPSLALACAAAADRRDRQRRAVGVADQHRAAAHAPATCTAG